MSGRELVEVRNVADAVGLVLSKRSDTMRRQARKRYLQVVERNGGPGRDRTDDLFHAMEARSQLRHRPTWCGGQLLSFNSRLASPPRQTRLAWSMSNRIWLAKDKGHNRSPHVELAEYSRSVTFLFRLHHYHWACGGVCSGSGWGARRGRRAAAGGVCVGERTERHRGAIEADGTKHAIRSRKDAHREMEDGRCDQATDAGECGVHSAERAFGAAG